MEEGVTRVVGDMSCSIYSCFSTYVRVARLHRGMPRSQLPSGNTRPPGKCSIVPNALNRSNRLHHMTTQARAQRSSATHAAELNARRPARRRQCARTAEQCGAILQESVGRSGSFSRDGRNIQHCGTRSTGPVAPFHPIISISTNF